VNTEAANARKAAEEAQKQAARAGTAKAAADAAAALANARATLNDSSQDLNARSNTMNTEAANARKAAEEAQKQAARAGTAKAAADTAAAQEYSASTEGLLTVLNQKIKERSDQQDRIKQVNENLYAALTLYDGIALDRLKKERVAALDAIKPAMDSQDPARIVDAIAEQASAWTDPETQTALQNDLNSPDKSDLEKVEALADTIKKDAEKSNGKNSGQNKGVLGVQ
jgi:hypothetical protein